MAMFDSEALSPTSAVGGNLTGLNLTIEPPRSFICISPRVAFVDFCDYADPHLVSADDPDDR